MLRSVQLANGQIILAVSLEPGFTIEARRDADDFLEDAREIIRIVVADFAGNFVDGLLRQRQHRAGTLHLEMEKIIRWRVAGLLLEQKRKMRHRQSGILRHVTER